MGGTAPARREQQLCLFLCLVALIDVPSCAMLWDMSHTDTTAPMVEINGFALRAIRVRSGIDAGPFAEQVGIDRSYLNRIENGRRRRIQPSTLAALLDALALTDQRALLASPHATEVAG